MSGRLCGLRVIILMLSSRWSIRMSSELSHVPCWAQCLFGWFILINSLWNRIEKGERG